MLNINPNSSYASKKPPPPPPKLDIFNYVVRDKTMGKVWALQATSELRDSCLYMEAAIKKMLT